MTDRYLRIPTSVEVIAVIRARHGNEMTVFGSFSDPTGTAFGGSGETGVMKTLWGFRRADCPLYETISKTTPPESDNTEYEYYLCAALEES